MNLTTPALCGVRFDSKLRVMLANHAVQICVAPAVRVHELPTDARLCKGCWVEACRGLFPPAVHVIHDRAIAVEHIVLRRLADRIVVDDSAHVNPLKRLPNASELER